MLSPEQAFVKLDKFPARHDARSRTPSHTARAYVRVLELNQALGTPRDYCGCLLASAQ